MSAITAERAAAIMIDRHRTFPMANGEVVDRFIRRFSLDMPKMTVIWPEAALKNVRPIAASWLEAVQQRINDSIALPGNDTESAGRYLDKGIAQSANTVFRMTSDLLPSEPYIYSTRTGDLVAEFEAPKGRLTTIISESLLIAFAVVEDVPIEKHIDLEDSNFKTIRKELHNIISALHTGRLHGQVEP